MKAIHGGKAKTDKIDAGKLASFLGATCCGVARFSSAKVPRCHHIPIHGATAPWHHRNSQ